MNTIATYGVFLWLPRILRDASGFSGLGLGAITATPLLVALVAMVLIGPHSDRTGERKWHVVASLSRPPRPFLAPRSSELAADRAELHAVQIGQRSVLSVFWAIPPAFLGGTAAAAGIAMINSIGNLGGALGPTVMEWRQRQSTGTYTGRLPVLVGALVVEAGTGGQPAVTADDSSGCGRSGRW